MKITALAAERAGVLEDLVVRDVSPGLTVWTGANESGKTTLFELVRASLFGRGAAARRDRRGEAFRELLADARGVRVEVATGDGDGDDDDGDEPLLLAPGEPLPPALWSGLDPATAERLHAVDAEALTSLDLLTSAEHRARLAGALAGAESLPLALRTLDRRLADLLKPGRGARNPTIDATTRELADLDERLAHLRTRSERYRELVRERREAEVRADELTAELPDLPPAEPPEPAPGPAVTPAPQELSSWPALAAASSAFLGLAGAVVLAFLDQWAAAAGALALAAAAAFLAFRAHRRPRPGSAAPQTSPPLLPENDSRDRRRHLETRLADTWRRIGSLDHELEALETSDHLATALARREAVRTTRADAVETWATAALARALLERARERSEAERVPRVLARASSLLQLLTGDRDLRLRLDGDHGDSVVLVGLTHGTRQEGAWSTGLADLVELAVRWALLREIAEAEAVPSGPLLLDDVHLRLDPERRRNLALALLELSRERQVMAFSCQPGLARDVEELLEEGAGGGVAVDLRRL